MLAKHCQAQITVHDLAMAYGDQVIQKGLDFTVRPGDIFIIMGASGSGKSTLLRHLTGLSRPVAGSIYYGQTSYWGISRQEQTSINRRFGVLYQRGALWSALTLAENIALPLTTYTDMSQSDIAGLVSFKLALVGLAGFEDYYPAEISGGMIKRAGLARAIALDPDILFLDEPSAGLDPLSSKHLDDLILQIRDTLGSTIVVVTHELDSIFAIGDDSIFLDTVSGTLIARGNPEQLRDNAENPAVRAFLNRGASNARTVAGGTDE